jgi:hypothetical protein
MARDGHACEQAVVNSSGWTMSRFMARVMAT